MARYWQISNPWLFGLHLTVFCLGILGCFSLIPIWLIQTNSQHTNILFLIMFMLVNIVVCYSGAQGMCTTMWSRIHTVSAILNLIIIAFFTISISYMENILWIIYGIPVFIIELWVTILRIKPDLRVVPTTSEV